MGFITVVIQLALLFVFSIYCQNTIANDQSNNLSNPDLLFDKVDKECVAWRTVPCQKGMTPTSVISQEKMDDSSESSICMTYQLIPCINVESRNYLIHNGLEEQKSSNVIENEKRLNECEVKNKRSEEDLAVVLRKLKDCRPTNQLADNQCKFSP
jgi:hypothetical protein